jgi:hypothetical protein
VGSQEGVQTSPEAGDSVGELVGEGPLPSVELPDRSAKGPVEPLAPLGALQGVQGRDTAGADGQSSIPRVGEDGTAMPRAGIRPAR